jgi:hypothetical protein
LLFAYSSPNWSRTPSCIGYRSTSAIHVSLMHRPNLSVDELAICVL